MPHSKKVPTIPPPDDLVSATVDAHRASRAPSTTKQHVRIVVKIRDGVPGVDSTEKAFVDLVLDPGMPAQSIADELKRLVMSVGLHSSPPPPDEE
jgi:hypothetical protein